VLGLVVALVIANRPRIDHQDDKVEDEDEDEGEGPKRAFQITSQAEGKPARQS